MTYIGKETTISSPKVDFFRFYNIYKIFFTSTLSTEKAGTPVSDDVKLSIVFAYTFTGISATFKNAQVINSTAQTTINVTNW